MDMGGSEEEMLILGRVWERGGRGGGMSMGATSMGDG